MEKDLLRFCTSGSVDDGKSTLLGRLLYETGNIYQDQIQAVKNFSKRKGKDQIDYSYFLDGLESEREQGITIDVAYRYFETPTRRYIVADTPGHQQYTRNMITGASNCSLAVILIDAQHGVLTQSKRHGFLISLLNIQRLVVVVNKMDLVDWDEETYNKIVNDYKEFSQKLGISDIRFVPVSAVCGDNVCSQSSHMPWYSGQTVLDILQTVSVNSSNNLIDFRFPVQSVIRPNEKFRGFAGTVASGSISVGEPVVVLPSNKKTAVKSITYYKEQLQTASCGDAVILELADQIDVDRGDCLCRENNLPTVSSSFQATLCWLDETSFSSKTYLMKIGTKQVNCFVNSIIYKIDVNTLHREQSQQIELNDIFKANLETTQKICFDPYTRNRETGSFILIDPDTNNTVACGMIKDSVNGQKDEVRYLSGEAVSSSKKKGKTVWMTGLSGSGKSTIAQTLWKALDTSGVKAVILDGDSVRKGLCSDLGFSLEDRRENLRRVAEVCKLLNENGIHVITAFISPTAEDRETACKVIGEYNFIETYVKCTLETCEKRDSKGLYQKARKGEIKNFTGIDSPYIEPQFPHITIDTEVSNKFESAETILKLLTGA